MARSLFAAVFFAEAFAMIVGKGERCCNRGKPSVILLPAAHEPHLVPAFTPALVDKLALPLHPNKIAGLEPKRIIAANMLNCEPLSKFADR